MNSLYRLSKITGFGYLIIFLTGFFANFFVLDGLIVHDNVSATFNNIVANSLLLRFGILSFFIMVLVDLVLAWTLYLLLKPVNKEISLLTAWFRLLNAGIFGVALFHLFNILPLINANKFSLFVAKDRFNQVALSLDAFNHTWLIGLVFFGIHLLLLGYLIIKSDYIPGILGVLLIIASLGYLTDSFAYLLSSDYSEYKSIFMLIVAIPGVIGELSFTLWLLSRGVRDRASQLSKKEN
jgi:hypothetical protein